MAEYRTPGVYVEEVERGPRTIEGVSTSTTGFLGETERGPTEPQRITSFSDYRRTFGGPVEDVALAYAIDGYFRNGGSRCYVARIVPEAWLGNRDATARGTLEDGDGNGVLEVTAVGPGQWGDGVVVGVDNASVGDEDRFRLMVGYWDELPEGAGDGTGTYREFVEVHGDPNAEEVYDDLSLDERSGDYYESRVNGPSYLVEVDEADEAGRPENGVNVLKTDLSDQEWEDATVTNGDYDGKGLDDHDHRTGLTAFEEIDDIAILCVPDENGVVDANGSDATDQLRTTLVDHCDDVGARFAIMQAERTVKPGDLPTDDMPASRNVGFYYPWVSVTDPETGLRRWVPPGGHVAGLYARTDQERGVHKAPANEGLRGVHGLQFSVTKEEQGSLNPKGVNCIRQFRGRGIRVWGARTTSSNSLWKYVNVRRLMLFIQDSIEEGTQWVVFESNDEETWARVRQTVSNFLTNVWNDGALMGTSPDEAFYVKCDRTTMTQDDIDNGRLIVEIGVAPVKPAEFVIFRISQWTGGQEGA